MQEVDVPALKLVEPHVIAILGPEDPGAAQAVKPSQKTETLVVLSVTLAEPTFLSVNVILQLLPEPT
ncbi:MAG: hypothetical protein QXO02_08435 [Thermofilaceae archaeon]